jgi:hypothetical protein
MVCVEALFLVVMFDGLLDACCVYSVWLCVFLSFGGGGKEYVGA